MNGAGAGWLSKPFRCQDESNWTYLSEDRSGFAQFFGTLAAELALEDCVLYTAPEKPGKYKVQAFRMKGGPRRAF